MRMQWGLSQEEEQEQEVEVEGLEDGEERTGPTQVDQARHHAREFVGFGTVTGAVGEVGIAFAWSTARGSPRACSGAGGGREVVLLVTSSHPDISTAAPLFIAARVYVTIIERDFFVAVSVKQISNFTFELMEL